jgi:fructokinase
VYVEIKIGTIGRRAEKVFISKAGHHRGTLFAHIKTCSPFDNFGEITTMTAPVPIREQLVVSIGELLWDVIDNQRYVGGAPFNFAYHSRALGTRSALISRVSQDDLGADLIHRAESLHVDTRGIQRDPAYPTGIVTAEMRSDGTVTYVFPEECAWDHIRFGDRERELIDFANVICFGTLAQRSPASRSAIMAAVSSAPTSAMCFLDLNLRAPYFSREIITQCLHTAHTLKLNEEELSILRRIYQLGSDDETAILQLMERFNIETLVLTRGCDGASAWNRKETAHAASYNVNVVDTVGCGDAFGAAFTTKLVAGHSLAEALEYGNIAGAFVASQAGATPDYTTATLEEFRREVPRTAVPRNAEDYQLPRA